MLYKHKQMNLTIFPKNNYTDKMAGGDRKESKNPGKFWTQYSKYILSD